MLYGAAVWDPTLIIAQIISLQCLFYLSLGLWQMLLLGAGIRVVHAGKPLRQHVERAKKCLDFASTAYFLHLVACWGYEGFPLSLAWWTVNALGLLITSLLGEWLCVRREMQEIPLGSLRGRNPAASPSAATGAGGSAGLQISSLGASSAAASMGRAHSGTRLLGADNEV
ncbi:hypothetical protein QJQ45_025593 [Haematococcus lacustris]|nr:hypothetical protein QJQ45_025593 [Haematococcus lacustris]